MAVDRSERVYGTSSGQQESDHRWRTATNAAERIDLMKTTLSTITLAGTVATLIALAGCGTFSDIKTEKLADRAAAAKTIERGWLPERLPENAQNIELAYNIDTNARAAVWSGSKAPDPACAAIQADEANTAINKNPLAIAAFKDLDQRNPVKCGDYYQADSGDKTLLWS